jgi:hypothetical protein
VQGEGSVRSFRRESSELAVTVQSRLGVTAAEGVRAAVLADVGLTIASEWMFSSELRSGAVRAVLLEWSLPALDLWAVFPSGHATAAKVRAFADFFERTFNAWPRRPTDVAAMSTSAMADETNEHVFDPGQHSALWVNEYGDTQRSCSSRASCQGVSPCPASRS